MLGETRKGYEAPRGVCEKGLPLPRAVLDYVEATTNDEAPVMPVLDEALATRATIIIHLPAIKQLGTITAIVVGFVSDPPNKRG